VAGVAAMKMGEVLPPGKPLIAVEEQLNVVT
jgi:hypothetical protein